MALMLKGGHLVDPQVGLDMVGDLLIEKDRIAVVGEDLDQAAYENLAEELEVRDMVGKIIVPGLVDIHVHLREPGYEQKEDIASGTRAAVHGGFTTVCAMPNTKPVIDDGAAVEFIVKRAEETASCEVIPSGACTKGLQGESLSEMGDMVARGAKAFTDDGRGVQDAGMFRRVMEYAKPFNVPVMVHCQVDALVGEGQVNEGVVSTRLGLAGWPAEGEECEIARDIAICRMTGTPLHIQHITTERGLDLVRDAKEEGLPVTCEVTPHHMFLSEDDIGEDYNTSFKVNPPLRTPEDALALIQGVEDGSVDVIVTDHAPHTAWEKDREFELAPFGMIGIETSLGLVLTNLVRRGIIDYQRLVELMAVKPREILNLEPVSLRAGSKANITVFDPEIRWTVSADEFESKARNSAFIGQELIGRATDVYVGGVAKMKEGTIVE